MFTSFVLGTPFSRTSHDGLSLENGVHFIKEFASALGVKDQFILWPASWGEFDFEK